MPTADMRFHRTERMRADVPGPALLTARLLDRNGRAMPVPIAISSRDDADGTRWQSAALALMPFAAGDYVMELSWQEPVAGSAPDGAAEVTRTLVAFRIVP